MTTTAKTIKHCHKCGMTYQAWRCPRCYKGHQHSSGGSTFSRRGGASSVLGHQSWDETDQIIAHANTAPFTDEQAAKLGAFVAVALSDDKFDALNRQESENRAAADDDFAMFR